MHMERPTAILLLWRHNFAAIGREHTNCSFVDVAKYLVHNAAADKAHSIALLSQGRCNLWQLCRDDLTTCPMHKLFWHFKLSLEWRWQRIHQIKQPCFVDQCFQSTALIEL